MSSPKQSLIDVLRKLPAFDAMPYEVHFEMLDNGDFRVHLCRSSDIRRPIWSRLISWDEQLSNAFYETTIRSVRDAMKADAWLVAHPLGAVGVAGKWKRFGKRA